VERKTKDKRDGGSRFVTHIECQNISEDVKEDLKTLKKALVGEDLRGGMRKDFTEMRSQVDKLLANNKETKVLDKEKRVTILKLKIAALGFAFVLLGIFIEYILNKWR